MEVRHAVERKVAELDGRTEGLCDMAEAGDGGLREAAAWITFPRFGWVAKRRPLWVRCSSVDGRFEAP
jgi:hypothetical protein